jgi:hypothetical protein
MAAWAAVLLLTFANSSCGDATQDDPFASYFREVDERRDLDRALGQLLADLEREQRGASDDVMIVLIRDYYGRILPVWDEITAHLRDIQPPEPVIAYHEQLVAAFSDVGRGMAHMVAELQGVTSPDEARTIALRDLVPAILRWQEACREIQLAAAAEGVEGGFACVDLLAVPA